jgi:hypothetical protein
MVEKGYKGVRGWLLLLCLILTILYPLGGLISITAVIDTPKSYFDQDPALFTFILIGGICNICLFVYSMYVGVSLWKVAPNAVTSAKRYLLVLFHYSFLSIFLPQLVGLSEKIQTEIYAMYSLSRLVAMAEAFLWYLYIRKSKRVRATYGEGEPITP